MKKISLIFMLLVPMGISKTFAGSLNIINLTPCTFEFYTGKGHIVDAGTGALLDVFSFGPITAGPGTNSFPNPTLLPGFSSNAPANLQPSGCVVAIKATGPGGTFIYLDAAASNSTFNSTNNPACNNGGNYVITWNTGGNGCDVGILIL